MTIACQQAGWGNHATNASALASKYKQTHKPVAITEFGATDGNQHQPADAAVAAIAEAGLMVAAERNCKKV